MNKLVSILMIILFANTSFSQTNNYSNLWTDVENFEIEGLPKSALKALEKIETKAKAENNSPQLIKIMLFKSKFMLTLEEDAQLSIINAFKAEINRTNAPTKNVLENILATLYWQYFQQNRWKFYNRTKTNEKVDTEDFRTWDLETLFEEIHISYKNSLDNGLILQQTDLKDFDVLLNKNEGSKIYRPTLFDFLAHNALKFYNHNESRITRPAYKFIINDASYLSASNEYANLNIVSKDSSSLQLNALKLYKELIKFHLKDKEPYALAAVNIERLTNVKQHITINNKDAVFINALKAEIKNHKTHEVSALYSYQLASIYNAQGNAYNSRTNTEARWKIKEAIAICDAAIIKFPKSKGAQQCAVLKQHMENPTLQVTTESILPTQTEARLLITYKALDAINLAVYKLTEKQYKTFTKIYRDNEQQDFIKKLDTEMHWDAKLKNEKDFQTHTTEISLPKLNNGRYIITANTKTLKENFKAHTLVQFTNIAMLEHDDSQKKHLQFINRNNGEPIANANVELHYNYGNEEIETVNTTTNSKGKLTISKTRKRRNTVNVKIIASGDVAYYNNLYINNYYRDRNRDEKPRYNTFVFTDRSIYRPGQTVFFKGITMKTEDNKSHVIVNQNIKAILTNVNGETVKALELKTNDYGSVAGEFILPDSGLTGNFAIRLQGNNSHSGYANISVEEYKRPKFETNFKPITETVKVNDSVKVIGEALAFAGATISDAKVVYRVKRNVQYPRWYYWRQPNNTVDQGQEITQGETTTDASGNYEITFKAIPDESVDKTSLPIFKYEITADVTDINGETRSTTTIVNVGYHALTATIGIENSLDKTIKDHKITIDTKNLNGEFVPAKGTLKVYKLLASNNVLRPRPWNAPDYQNFTETEFKQRFPHEAYTNEHQPENWKKGALVFDKKFDTEKSKTLDLGNIKKWNSGEYIILLETKDKFGQAVKDEAKTRAFSEKDQLLADNQLFQITTNKETYTTSDTVELTLATAADNIWVTVDVEKEHKIINTYIVKLNRNKKSIRIPVTPKDLGGFAIHYSFAAFNSFHTNTVKINVPYPKTDLEIETLSFRDKLQPGTDETWKFKIKGPKGDKVAAELLASMYDASLDEFKPHNWSFNPIYRYTYYSSFRRNANKSFGSTGFNINRNVSFKNYTPTQQYDQLNSFGLTLSGRNNLIRSLRGRVAGIQVVDDEIMMEEVVVMNNKKMSAPVMAMNMNEPEEDIAFMSNDKLANDESWNPKNDDGEYNENKKTDFSDVTIRKNLQETAFFFPQLQTDEKGEISFSFTTPEALTKWKLQLLAHTKTLKNATTSLTTVTQKELMVLPNVPRFLRQGDQIKISTKISNLTDKELKGVAVLQLFDALTGESIDNALSNSYNELGFTVDAKGNTSVSWNLDVTDNVQAIQYKIIAKSGNYSDGEQNALPVLTNRMLVTESLPLWIRSNQTKTFTLDKLKTNTSTTLKNHKLTLEMTSNPAWYAVQALPYLMEYPYECNEQTFSRFYANALASHIANSNPRIQAVFNQWKNTDALLSNLEKNQELKSILIQETPWLRDAQSETEQKKRIALLFDLNKMNNELSKAKKKLKQNQMSSGAWSWFGNYRANRYITQHIITGFGHLKKLDVTSSPSTALRINSDETSKMIDKALRYLDAEFIKEYKDIRKYDKDADLNVDRLSYTQLHYLYMRSFFPENKPSKEVREIMDYYHSQIKTYWLKRPLYAKGMMALVTYRNKDEVTTAKILNALKETSITSEELGMYWKSNTNSWHWYQAPIETQALMIEAFYEAGTTIQNEAKNTSTIDELKIWLLKNKQTNRWKTTKATTDAVYALLLQGSDWLSVTDMVEVVIGNKPIEPSKLEAVKVEAGTGYYKIAWNGSEITPEMADVKIIKKGNGIAWGSLYWQYFEDLDKITSAETPLKLKKKLFKKTNTDKGEVITDITKDTKLEIGDLVRVRIELRSDRAMEFVHMKDMRAAGLEPVNVISKYKYQDGLGYYEATKDASTNFFFDYLPKGIYVFEYDLRVSNAGNMSNGITTIQSMYAPEFSSHSEGTRITVD
ncbi:alpha-2-macroglobulin family protein [Lacinutrix algicola]|uniref:alpha-2-macroglobulin family protein n=1 Tax=Lacinutrix algicola TaxID=342954 RepID=UPI0006E35303|nr:alpha-2-macroglobulin family protein [Lacinutrix algicola]